MVELFFNKTSTRTTTIFCSLFSLFCFWDTRFLTRNSTEARLEMFFFPGVFAGRWYNGRDENQTMYVANKRLRNLTLEIAT